MTITIDALSFRYSDAVHWAVRHIDLDVLPGELILLTGSSGSGKSTMLRSLNGLIPHFHGGDYSGRVEVDGLNTLEARPGDFASLLGLVTQNPEDLSVASLVEDDIAFTLENLAVPHPSMRKRLEEILDALGISSLRRRALGSLSGGERQRVAIAGALVAMPPYLAMDEPTSQLDPQSAEEVVSALLRLRDDSGIGIVLAEHRLERVLQYADRVAHIDEGELISGTPQLILEKTEIGPPVVELGRRLGERPLPLNLRDARAMVAARAKKPMKRASPATPGETVAFLRAASVSFGRTRALNQVDLSIRAGEILALMGRNGSGKTTALKAIAGLVDLSSGKRSVSVAAGYVPQNPDVILYRSTVAAEIAETLKANRLAANAASIGSVAELFNLTTHLSSNPRDLSGGERTRVAIAAATAADPNLILLDEPTRGLDHDGKIWLGDVLRQWSNRGKAVVIATHDVELAAAIAGRVVLMGEGEVVLDADPSSALADSLTFATQMNKVFDDPNVLTLADAERALCR